MMAPGLPEIAVKYGITDSTMIALTLTVFLISFAIGVCLPTSMACSLLTTLFSHYFWPLPRKFTVEHGYFTSATSSPWLSAWVAHMRHLRGLSSLSVSFVSRVFPFTSDIQN